LCIDARPPLAVFYRTRVRRARDLLLPRMAAGLAATILSFVVGTLAAWYETTVLIGPVPPAKLALGAGLTILYLVDVVCITAAAAAISRTQIAAIGLALAAIFSMPIIAVFPSLSGWMPSQLAGSI